MPDTPLHIVDRIQPLSAVAAALSRAPAVTVLQLRNELLALPADDSYAPGGRSGLNADGTPLQFCISTSVTGYNGRFISDPACVIGSSLQRYRQSYQALQKLYPITGTSVIRPVCEHMLQFHLPASDENFQTDYPDGVLWLGASPDAAGLAVYMDGRRGGHDASWQRLLNWLNLLMPANTDGQVFVEQGHKHGSIMSIGLEGSTMENLRAKVYFRLLHPCLLNNLGIPLLQRCEFTTFCTDVIGNRPMMLKGLVFSVGFHIASGKLYDVKLDICGCNSCTNREAGEWMQLFTATTAQYALTPFPISKEMLLHECDVSYYGMGITCKGDVRLNLYLKNKPVNYAILSKA